MHTLRTVWALRLPLAIKVVQQACILAYWALNRPKRGTGLYPRDWRF